ncbi:hypothetical protein QOZ98_000527 [Planomicrobium stackebrandtii]|uniref:Uncharacterized protein n=1 Tax=Planomicrobium stackebrandtii TaxID=253160 RepID=A0ABU0GT08_9BACL|nr:hypothetical protein [Planomicrobium stackebrandtii]MDQ0427702.1 hypothetical protein [Planomicrobium stackebrandtii]
MVEMLMTPETKALIDERKNEYTGGKVKDANYDKLVAAIPYWKPTREIRTFGISAIQQICGCGFKDAMELRDTLEYQGGLPTKKWSDGI